MTSSNRAKFGYLTQEDMLLRIAEGQLDAYDIVFTKDSKETYIITENLEPSALRSKVYVFDSVTAAEEELNAASDTYVGQIVSVLYKDTYRGYIVNQKNDLYYLIPLYATPEPIDYDTLGNRPIINMVGTFDAPIVVSQLDSGLYSIKGQYTIAPDISTKYSSATGTLFMVEKSNDGTIYIKKISADDIIQYVVSGGVTKTNVYVTKDYLDSHGFATISYVDEKIAGLDFLTKEETETYINQQINQSFDTNIEEKVNLAIEEKFVETSDELIEDLFDEDDETDETV